MTIDVDGLVQKLLAELNSRAALDRARAEGVALLYDRIRQAAERPIDGNREIEKQNNKPAEQQEGQATPVQEALPQ